MNNNLYKEKYLKYKFKYLELKELSGGVPDNDTNSFIFGYISYNSKTSYDPNDREKYRPRRMRVGDLYIQNVAYPLIYYKLLKITYVSVQKRDEDKIKGLRKCTIYKIKGKYLDYKEYYYNNIQKDLSNDEYDYEYEYKAYDIYSSIHNSSTLNKLIYCNRYEMLHYFSGLLTLKNITNSITDDINTTKNYIKKILK